jgi:hypothetical protein
MTDVLTRLREANPVSSKDLAPSIEDVWQKLEDFALDERDQPKRRFDWPRTQRRVWSRLVIVGAGSVAVVAALLVFGTAGTGPSRAFAGWSATPTAAARGEIANALERCRAQLSSFTVSGRRTSFPRASWKPRLTDTRGPYTALILQSGAARAACLNGPSFTSTEANESHGRSSSSMLTPGSDKASVLSDLSGSGPIQNDWEVHESTRGGQPYTIVSGQALSRATRLTLELSDGRDVQATAGDGSFIAWWPGGSSARSARLTSGSCVTTQKLAFFDSMKPLRPGTSGPFPARRVCGPSSR